MLLKNWLVMLGHIIAAFMQKGDYKIIIGHMMSWTGFTQVGLPGIPQTRARRYSVLRYTSMMGLMAMSPWFMTTACGRASIYLCNVFTQDQYWPNYIVKEIHRTPNDLDTEPEEGRLRRAFRAR